MFFSLCIELVDFKESIDGIVLGFLVVKWLFRLKSGVKLIIVFLLEDIEVNDGENVILEV